MKILRLQLTINVFILTSIILILTTSSCKKVEADYRLTYFGEYQFTRTIDHWDDFNGSGSYILIDTGTIKEFKGQEGNEDDIEHKIRITYDENGLTSMETSCYNNLTYGAYDQIHPTVSSVGLLTYPEYECYAWTYNSHFSGQIFSDSIYMSYGYWDATHGRNVIVQGKRIN